MPFQNVFFANPLRTIKSEYEPARGRSIQKDFSGHDVMLIELVHKGRVLSPNRRHQSHPTNTYQYTKVKGYTAQSFQTEIHSFFSAWMDTVGFALSPLLAKEFISDSVYITPMDYFVGGRVRYQLATEPCGPGPSGAAEKGLPLRTTICMTLDVGMDSKHNGRKIYSVLSKGSCDKNRIGKEFPLELLTAWTEFGKILVRPIEGWQLSVGRTPVVSATPIPKHRKYTGGRW